MIVLTRSVLTRYAPTDCQGNMPYTDGDIEVQLRKNKWALIPGIAVYNVYYQLSVWLGHRIMSAIKTETTHSEDCQGEMLLGDFACTEQPSASVARDSAVAHKLT